MRSDADENMQQLHFRPDVILQRNSSNRMQNIEQRITDAPQRSIFKELDKSRDVQFYERPPYEGDKPKHKAPVILYWSPFFGGDYGYLRGTEYSEDHK